MGVIRWRVRFTDYTREQLSLITDKRIQGTIRARIRRLSEEPEKQGKALSDDLEGYRSVRAVGQRYRIVYKVQKEQVIVLVVTVGIRKDGDKKDAYALAKRLADLGVLDE